MRTTTFLDPSRRVPGTKRRDGVRARRGGAALDAAEALADSLARGAATGRWSLSPKLEIDGWICDVRSARYDRAEDTLVLRFTDGDFCDGPSEVTVAGFSRTLSGRAVDTMTEGGAAPKTFRLHWGREIDPGAVALNGTPIRRHPDNPDAERIRLMVVEEAPAAPAAE